MPPKLSKASFSLSDKDAEVMKTIYQPYGSSSKQPQYSTHNISMKLQEAERVKKQSGVTKVCIIGGGVAGIVTARVMLAEGIDCVIYEKTGTLGGVWSDNYAGFGIQVPSPLYEFPDEPLPRGWDFAAGEMIHTYARQYAAKHGVDDIARLNCSVTKVVRDGPTKWNVTITNASGKAEVENFDYVVVATGVYSSVCKFIPSYPGQEKFKGTWIHSVDFKNLDICKGKHVWTVGGGKSAFDCAQLSAKVAEKSTLLTRAWHWPVPRKILGLIPFEFATFNRFGIGCLLPAYPKQGPIEKITHAIPFFLSFFWWLVAKIFAWQFGLGGTPDLTPKKGFIEDFWGGHGIIPHPDFIPLVRCGMIGAIEGNIKEVKEKSLVLDDGKEYPADIVLFGTGFKPDLSFLPEEITSKTEKDGLWMYRQMIHPDFPSLCFLNSNTTTFTNITTASIQARWLVEMLANGFPDKAAMNKEIDIQKTWKRKAMPNAGHARAYMIQTHQVHYYDELLRDMGASIRRKRGWFRPFKEFFDPYRPRDYDTIVTGEFKLREGEATQPGSKQKNFLKEFVLMIFQLILMYFFVKYFAIFLTKYMV